MMTTTEFVPVREVYDGGTGVPVPVYRCTFKGEPLAVVSKAREALDWIEGRNAQFAVYAVIDGGIEREVARGR